VKSVESSSVIHVLCTVDDVVYVCIINDDWSTVHAAVSANGGGLVQSSVVICCAVLPCNESTSESSAFIH